MSRKGRAVVSVAAPQADPEPRNGRANTRLQKLAQWSLAPPALGIAGAKHHPFQVMCFRPLRAATCPLTRGLERTTVLRSIT